MGDRVSIQFVEKSAYWKTKAEDPSAKSVALFDHWGGFPTVKLAQKYIHELNKTQKKEDHVSDPMTRREPSRLIADFIAWLERNGHFDNSIYLGVDGSDGDNSDNGNWLVDVHTGDIDKG
jgi:hypothetical protein